MMKNKKPEPKKVMLGFSPHKGQKRLLNALMNSFVNKNVRNHTCNIGRQWGKSLMICNYYLWICCNFQNKDLAYITPTFKLAKKIFREFVNAIEGAPVVKKNGINKTDLIVEFNTGCVVRFGSGENPMSWRGNTLDVCTIDEAAFCMEELWDVIEPTLRIKRGVAIFISTPNGRNWFWNLYQRDANEIKGWKSYTAPSWESPYIPKDEIDEIKKYSLTQWRIEYNAEFIEDDTQVFRNVDLQTEEFILNNRSDGDIIYLGLDLGRKNDSTVMIAFDSNKRVRDILRVNKKDWSEIIPELVQFYFKWKPVFGYCENNHNDYIIDELIKTHNCKNLKPLNTNVATKPEQVQNLTMLFDNKEIHLPAINEEISGNRHTKILNAELKQYAFKYNIETQNMKYGAPRNLHDDCVSALMCAALAWKHKNPKSKNILWEKF